MRVLLTSTALTGHVTPLLPFAHAARRRRDEVRFVVPPRLAGTLREAGWAAEAGGEPPADELDAIWRRVPEVSPDEAAELVNRHVFGRLGTAAMLPAVEQACDAWRPDLVLRDPCEYAAAVAAQRRGIPHAHVAISLAEVEDRSLERARPELEPYLAGVTERIHASPYLTRFPASLDPSPFPHTLRFREDPGGRRPAAGVTGAAATAAKRWQGTDGDPPLIYATLGTVTYTLSLALAAHRTVLDAVADLPARVLLTTGREVDPATLGPLPANVHVEPWVDQADALAHARVMVCHGGSGSTFGALAAGVPLVILPLFADQPVNGRLVAEAGAGLVVDADPTDPTAAAPRLREAIRAVLADPMYRAGAERVAAEMATAASIDDVLASVAG